MMLAWLIVMYYNGRVGIVTGVISTTDGYPVGIFFS